MKHTTQQNCVNQWKFLEIYDNSTLTQYFYIRVDLRITRNHSSGPFIIVYNIAMSYNTGKSTLPDIYAQRPRAYISDKARVPVL